MSDTKNHITGYEKKDANAFKLLIFITVFVVALTGVIMIADSLFVNVREQDYYDAVLSPESMALRELKSAEDETLKSYGVIDAQKGLYRIPIEQAMKLMVEEAYKSEMK